MKLVLSVLTSLIFICSLSITFASIDNHGIDDWNTADVNNFFKTEGIPVPVDFLDSLKSKGIDTGIEGLTMTDENLKDLGIVEKSITKYKKAASSKIESVKRNPVDLFEWRVVHRRLCDFWILPMIANPTIGLLWARFTEHSEVVEKQDDEIDNLTTQQFWLTWIICPSLPFWLISKKFTSFTFVDEIISWALCIYTTLQCLYFLVVILCILTNNLNFALDLVKNRLILTVYMGLATFISYYGLYWFIPGFIEDTFFYFFVYIVLPAIVIIFFLLTVGGLITVVDHIFWIGGIMRDQKKKDDFFQQLFVLIALLQMTQRVAEREKRH